MLLLGEVFTEIDIGNILCHKAYLNNYFSLHYLYSFGDRDSHSATLLLLPGSAPPAGSLDLTAQLLPNRGALLPDHSFKLCSEVSVAGLSPVHFRGPQPRWVSCYALFKGWLLLSLPSHCLRLQTLFGLTLSRHLGTLTSVWVVPLSVQGLTPRHPSLAIYSVCKFGV